LNQIKKLSIRCLTSTSKGYGNFSRCLYLAESLRKKNCKVSFIIDYNESVIQKLKKQKFNYISIPKKKSFLQEVKFLMNYLQKNDSKFCVIDMREYGENISKILFKNNFQTILFDDAWCKKVYSDVLFNGTNVKEYQNYTIINKNSKVFLGTKYWIVDKNFKESAKKITSIKQTKIPSIVISMGGSDVSNLTTNVVKALSDVDKIKISVIIGPFFSCRNELKKIIKLNKNITLNISPTKIWKQFSKSNIVISNGGNTLFELACLGIPTLCIPSVKHEIKFAEVFNSQNFSINLNLRQRNHSIIKSAFLKLLDDLTMQKEMCVAGKKIVDGNGLPRVAKIILKFL
jgi:UDP-2,4-diacetamido-2,4,6-trideoxy-beta-L-altropyranose hydrolase